MCELEVVYVGQIYLLELNILIYRTLCYLMMPRVKHLYIM